MTKPCSKPPITRQLRHWGFPAAGWPHGYAHGHGCACGRTGGINPILMFMATAKPAIISKVLPSIS